MEENREREQSICLNNRRDGKVSGVTDVQSFDTGEIHLETTLGRLVLKGKELHISRLTLEKGEVEFTGQVQSMAYLDGNPSRKNQPMIKRLFG